MSTGIPLPFALANQVPILNHIRIPMRYGLMVFFGAAVLAGAGALVLVNWRRWVFVPISVLILLEAAIMPYPTLEFRVPAVYDQIAREPGDFTVLEIPSFHWRFAAKNEAYQATHQKRILRAYTNRIAPDVADYFNLRQTPIVVRSLRILEGAEEGVLTDEEMAEDRSVLDETLNLFNVRYAVLHRDQLEEERANQVDAYLREVLGATVFYQDENVTAYQVGRGTRDSGRFEIEIADNTSLMYLGRGWQIEPLADADGKRGRYVRGSASEIYFPKAEGTAGLVLNTLGGAGTGDDTFQLDEETLEFTRAKGESAFIISLQDAEQERLNRLRWNHKAGEEEEGGMSIELVP